MQSETIHHQQKEFDIIISTCNAYSDIWDGTATLINQNWSNRNTNTFLITDAESHKKYDGITIISAGEGKEITERLRFALDFVQSEYIVFLLDDYFLTEKIDNHKIDYAIGFMKENKVDYLRLYSASKSYLKREGAVPVHGYPGFYIRNIEHGDYKISLYPGIWKTSFMKKTVNKKMNAWQYEVALTQMARDFHAKCAISNHHELPFLDVIRKGKLLRKANRYLKRNPVCAPDRQVMRAADEYKITFSTFLRHHLPRPLFVLLKRVLSKFGKTFYSSVE